MEINVNQATKLLALSFTSEIIKKRYKKRKHSDDECSSADSSDISFGELESDYQKVIATLQAVPEVRETVVQDLKQRLEKGEDLNAMYPADKIAEKTSLRKVLFLKNDKAA